MRNRGKRKPTGSDQDAGGMMLDYRRKGEGKVSMKNSIQLALELSMDRKRSKIERFLQLHHRNLHDHLPQLYGFARTYAGLMRDDFREKIWPVLATTIPCVNSSEMRNRLGSAQQDSTEDFIIQDDSGPSMRKLRSHKDWRQVEMDVKRTMARFPSNMPAEEREKLQRSLTVLVIQLMSASPEFGYYQGFHDVCLTLLLVLDEPTAFSAARSLTKRAAFSKYLTLPIEGLVTEELQYIYVILWLHDPVLELHMRGADLGTTFAISWPLTWFSHDLRKYSQTVLFFDLLLTSHHLMPFYIGAALIIERREEVLLCEREMPALHQLLTQIPPNINANRIVDAAQRLINRYPPVLLEGEYKREYQKMVARSTLSKRNE